VKFLKYALVATLIVAILAVTCIWYEAHRIRKVAEAYLADVQHLSVGKSSFEEVNTLRQRYSRYSSASPDCTAELCVTGIGFTNEWLSRYRLMPFRGFGSELSVHKGVLREISAMAICYGPNGGPPFVVHVDDALPNPLTFAGPFSSGGTTLSGDKRDHIVIHLTPAATAEQHDQAYRFTPQFLDLGGKCNDANDMFQLPAADKEHAN
jgi:hypothetical protein